MDSSLYLLSSNGSVAANSCKDFKSEISIFNLRWYKTAFNSPPDGTLTGNYPKSKSKSAFTYGIICYCQNNLVWSDLSYTTSS